MNFATMDPSNKLLLIIAIVAALIERTITLWERKRAKTKPNAIIAESHFHCSVDATATKVTAGFELAKSLPGNELWLRSGRRERNQEAI